MRTPSKKPLSLEEFRSIYSKVNRLNIEIVIKTERGYLLTLRSIDPYINLWHLPGGIVHFRESLKDAVRRVGFDELGVEIEPLELLGYIEYPSIKNYGDIDSPVGIAFSCKLLSNNIQTDSQSSKVNFFKQIPEDTILEQKEFLENLER
jgi:ADP-ribose pyrophosphatase YjhB (NUDIX family)